MYYVINIISEEIIVCKIHIYFNQSKISKTNFNYPRICISLIVCAQLFTLTYNTQMELHVHIASEATVLQLIHFCFYNQKLNQSYLN